MLQGKVPRAGPSDNEECLGVSLIEWVVRGCVKQSICESLKVKKKVVSLRKLK